MAGGIFTDRPFYFNIKCVAFGSLLSLGYWFTATYSQGPTIGAVAAIMIVSYIAMAWYDWLYNCSTPLLSGRNGPVGFVDSIWKPQNSNALNQVDAQAQSVLAPDEQCKEYVRHVWIFQGVVTAPIMMYMAYTGVLSPESSVALGVLSVAQMIWAFAYS